MQPVAPGNSLPQCCQAMADPGWEGDKNGEVSVGAPSSALSLVSICAKTFLSIELQGRSLVWSGAGSQAGVGTTGGHV